MFTTIDHVYVTPLVRTKQTAEILFGNKKDMTEISDLREVNFGQYEGSVRTAENSDDPVFYKWVHSPQELTFPEGDNLLEHSKKAFSALLKIKDSGYQNVLIISHATTIRMLLSIIISGKMDYFRNIPCNNGRVSKLETEGNQFIVRSINASLSF